MKSARDWGATDVRHGRTKCRSQNRPRPRPRQSRAPGFSVAFFRASSGVLVGGSAPRPPQKAGLPTTVLFSGGVASLRKLRVRRAHGRPIPPVMDARRLKRPTGSDPDRGGQTGCETAAGTMAPDWVTTRAATRIPA